jgi:hypothetical protein
MNHLTIAYFTSRKEPLISWFFDSLDRELAGDYTNKKIIVVDFWAEEAGRGEFIRSQASAAANEVLVHVTPKPSVFQGRYRKMKDHWWDAAGARNTALCLAPDGWLLHLDDLSVMLPGYGVQIRAAMEKPDFVTCGAYRKVKQLVVDKGNIQSFEDHPGGNDVRYQYGSDLGAVPCEGNWLFGCSVLATTEALLSTGGWPEALTAALSMEDVLMGLMLRKRGYSLQYDRRMMTYESEEHHHTGPTIRRSDYGTSPHDKSHAALRIIQQGDGFHPNYFEAGGIRALRQYMLSGGQFPIPQVPEHDWYTGATLYSL